MIPDQTPPPEMSGTFELGAYLTEIVVLPGSRPATWLLVEGGRQQILKIKLGAGARSRPTSSSRAADGTQV